VIFLAEAFTPPSNDQALAKEGFDQSYTYFTWRNTKQELTDYLHELSGETHEYFRPNFFGQHARYSSATTFKTPGQLAFVLASLRRRRCRPPTACTPARTLRTSTANAGSEEYLHSEKYEIKHRRLDGPLLPLYQKGTR